MGEPVDEYTKFGWCLMSSDAEANRQHVFHTNCYDQL